VEARAVNNALVILDALDQLLEAPVDLTLYGRAALALGFHDPPEEYAWSRDVDVVLRDDPIDQADARFIYSRAGFSREDVEQALRSARVPKIPEIREQFHMASERLLKSL